MEGEIIRRDDEKRVLGFLAAKFQSDQHFYFAFDTISDGTKIDRKTVRRACRSLKRKGLTAFRNGLFNEDGAVAGSGYAATEQGFKAAQKSGFLLDLSEID